MGFCLGPVPKTPKPIIAPSGQNPKKLSKKDRFNASRRRIVSSIDIYINHLNNLRKPLLFGKKKYAEEVKRIKQKISDLEYELLLLENPNIEKEIEEIFE